jgi:hypothetical protein
MPAWVRLCVAQRCSSIHGLEVSGERRYKVFFLSPRPCGQAPLYYLLLARLVPASDVERTHLPAGSPVQAQPFADPATATQHAGE